MGEGMGRPLAGKAVLVTGGSRGLGAAIAVACAKAGADVAVAYHRERERAEGVAARVSEAGGKALVVQAEVSSRPSVREMLSRTLDRFGRLDGLVNSAGILQQKPFLTIDDADFDRMVAVNLKGTFLCAQEAFEIMRHAGGGRIVTLSSSGGQLGGTLAVHYAATKGGIIALTRSLARLGSPHRILVNCIAPGLIDTEMTRGEIASEAGREKIRQIPLGRAGEAEEVAGVAVFLLSPASAYLTGQTINVNGGLYLG